MENKLKLAHVYDITNYVEQQSKKDGHSYKYGYFISRNVFCVHIYRIVVGYNSEYEIEPRTKLIEQFNLDNNVLKDYVEENYGMHLDGDCISYPQDILDELLIKYATNDEKLKESEAIDFALQDFLKIIYNADMDIEGFSNCDVEEYRYDTPIRKLIEDIDGGYGITKVEIKC